MPTPPAKQGLNQSFSLLIVGASARAAAESAAKFVESIYTIDLFADQDTQALAESFQVDDLAEAGKLAKLISADVWMYTGGMENRPDVIAEISKTLPLAGVDDRTLKRLAENRSLFSFLRQNGIRVPPVEFPKNGLNGISDLAKPEHQSWPEHQKWLVKKLNSTGGQGVAHAGNLPGTRDWPRGRDCKTRFDFWQALVEGQSVSALFVANETDTKLLGCSYQKVGDPKFGASGFCYCASLGPIDLGLKLEAEILSTASNLAKEYRLKGLFGIDFVINNQGSWFIEMNPRLTASAEIFESETESVVWKHLQYSGMLQSSAKRPFAFRPENRSNVIKGKAILFQNFADRIVFGSKTLQQFKERRIEVADVPAVGTVIQAGHPILTIRAKGYSIPIVEQQLECAAEEIRNMIVDSGPVSNSRTVTWE